jgi:threonine/homoserine/homoserine lactone efflux protein
MLLTTLVAFAVACVVLNLVPGPGMLFITAPRDLRWAQAGVVAAPGMASGTVVHTVAAALGLSMLLTAAPLALDAVRVVGAAVLLYLAVTALRSARAGIDPGPRGQRRSLRRTYWSAVGPTAGIVGTNGPSG